MKWRCRGTKNLNFQEAVEPNRHAKLKIFLLKGRERTSFLYGDTVTNSKLVQRLTFRKFVPIFEHVALFLRLWDHFVETRQSTIGDFRSATRTRLHEPIITWRKGHGRINSDTEQKKQEEESRKWRKLMKKSEKYWGQRQNGWAGAVMVGRGR